MLFPTTFAALSVSLLLGAPAAANGLSHKYTSPEDPLGPAKHVTMTKIMVKKFIDFPAGGSTCDRAGHSSILFTRSEIQGALTIGLVGPDASAKYGKEDTNCTKSLPLYEAYAGDKTKGTGIYISFMFDASKGEATLCQAAPFNFSLWKGKLWPCVPLPKRAKLNITSTRYVPERIDCPQSDSRNLLIGYKNNIEAAMRGPTYQLEADASVHYDSPQSGPCHYLHDPVYEGYMLSGGVIEHFAFNAKTGVATHCTALATNCPVSNGDMTVCSEYT